ncbi:transcription termination factor 2 isoform X2 [Tribolium madens]|uniref:transcription termination factor 2 isoform X2 n=1 Tax=Tribolium madens TaxID=41895 RepID=UPI001CF73742|nr:transcription termination factor 2 isoform X2 [Tribolium madens]
MSNQSDNFDQEEDLFNDEEDGAPETENLSRLSYRETSQVTDDESDQENNPKTSQDTPEIIEDSLSIVEISDDEEPPSSRLDVKREPPEVQIENTDDEQPGTSLKQTKITSFVTKPTHKTVVGHQEYQEQVKKVNSIEADLLRTRNAMRVIKVENLPDRGKSLTEKVQSLGELLQKQKTILDGMEVTQETPLTAHNRVEVAWEEIEAGVDTVGPRTFGKIGVARFKAEKTMAMETLDSLHKSLETCPCEKDTVEEPQGLKIALMPHQKQALAWLLWREKQKPSGGLLADDMGLGKTITMISLVLKSQELNLDNKDKENHDEKRPGGTLVVCPASLMNQWSEEIKRRTKRGLLSVEVYHGAKRETKPKRLAKHDIVITTYSLILNENTRDGAVFGVHWRRIILDEAHQIRNHKSKTSEAIFRLSGKSRWALTGTPVHNKELDMYAIFKFLRCSPFDDLQVWKHWVGDKSTGGAMRLHTVISSLMLRRTKADLMEKGVLESLPNRTWELISVKLEKEEMDVYQKVLIFSRTLFAQFLHQRAEKNQDAYDFTFNGLPPDPNGEYFKMRNRLLKLNRVKEVSQHDILVLLLRLRQICCHPSLIKQMLQSDEDLGNAEDQEESEELNLLEQLNRLNIDEEEEESNVATGLANETVGLKEASKGYLNPSNPVFTTEHASSKIRALINLLKTKIGEDKAIVVSQWTGLLHLVAIHLKNEGIPYDSLDGSVLVHKRMPIVDNFNDPNSATKVLLLSLTAGGVGLNLVGANHLFLLDLHWNPQLENQAQDRIYRMGQKKNIYVYKFMALQTIEERIKALQERKLEIANAMLTGSKQVTNSKLSLQDLKMLFDFQ